MKGIITYIKDVLSDNNGSPSTKRLVSFMFASLIAIAFISNLYWGYHVDANLVDSVMYVVIAGFGFTGIEKFAPNGMVGAKE